MVEQSQNTNPAPAGSSPATGNTLQPLAQTGLQPQASNSLQTPASSNLQPTSSQTIDSINQLDQGTGSINLQAISNTTTTQVVTPPVAVKPTPVALYAGAAIMVIGIMGYMVYRLLRPN